MNSCGFFLVFLVLAAESFAMQPITQQQTALSIVKAVLAKREQQKELFLLQVSKQNIEKVTAVSMLQDILFIAQSAFNHKRGGLVIQCLAEHLCLTCGIKVSEIRCDKCRIAPYCLLECQQKDKNNHVKECEEFVVQAKEAV